MDKAALLDAIAKSGSAGRAAYEQAQQSLAAQQAEAVRGALASGVAGQAGAGAQAQLQQIIGQPYESRTAALRQNQASMEDWYNRLGAMTGSWADQQNALQQVALQQALAQASGGGGGGGGGDTPESYYDVLKDKFGTVDLAKQAIAQEAIDAGSTNWRQTGVSPVGGQRAYAQFVYGVPAGVAADMFPESEFVSKAADYITGAGSRRQAIRRLGKLRESAREFVKQAPGSDTGYAVNRARQQTAYLYGPKAARKGWRRGAKGK